MTSASIHQLVPTYRTALRTVRYGVKYYTVPYAVFIYEFRYGTVRRTRVYEFILFAVNDIFIHIHIIFI